MPQSAATGALAVEGLGKAFGDALVLDQAGLRVPAGRVVALLGPSGCGKTTLLRCIAGLERPDAGQVRLDGRDLSAPGAFVAPERRRIGMVFQDGALFSHRTVLGNVNYGVGRGADRDERARRALRLVGLDDKAERMPGTLSGGEQQRVALARALAPEPGIVLLDEPFSSLDASLRVQLRDDVRRLLTDVGVTAVLVTHD
ncbi:MAG TPA: ABC transporter ATP-binding protein, partial [Actinomycetes bacterium]|nr:ABC transporter ATP-binding protein [Actinomycetes bacterium]